MSTTTLQFVLKISGAPTDPDGNVAVFSDPTGMIAVTRTDTGASVSPPAVNASLSRINTGIYQFAMTDPAPGLTYQWWVKWAIGGATQYTQFTTAGTPLPSGSNVNPYCSIEQLLAMYDMRNMIQLSGDANSRQGNPANVQFLLNMQASEFESAAYGRFDLPTLRALNPMQLILTKYVGATAGSRLWGRRADKPKALAADEEWAKNWISALMAGTVSIPGVERLGDAELLYSDSLNGRSRFDHIFGQGVSPTSVGGQGFCD